MDTDFHCHATPLAMHDEERAEVIVYAALWLAGLGLFAWSWYISGSFIAALIVAFMGVFFLILLFGPLIAFAAFLLAWLFGLIGPPSSRP